MATWNAICRPTPNTDLYPSSPKSRREKCEKFNVYLKDGLARGLNLSLFLFFFPSLFLSTYFPFYLSIYLSIYLYQSFNSLYPLIKSQNTYKIKLHIPPACPVCLYSSSPSVCLSVRGNCGSTILKNCVQYPCLDGSHLAL